METPAPWSDPDHDVLGDIREVLETQAWSLTEEGRAAYAQRAADAEAALLEDAESRRVRKIPAQLPTIPVPHEHRQPPPIIEEMVRAALAGQDPADVLERRLNPPPTTTSRVVLNGRRMGRRRRRDIQADAAANRR